MRKGVSGLLAGLTFVAAAACVPQTGGGGPAPNYGEIAPSTMASAGGLGACLSDDEATAVRARSLQQQLATATLLCTGRAGERTLGDRYNHFIERFQPDWPANVAAVRSVAAARRMDFNALVTDMANQAAARAAQDGSWCARAGRALDWALGAGAPPLSRVPPLYDNTGDLRLRPCVAPKATG